MLRSLIRTLRASLVQIDAVSWHWMICRRMCVRINGPGDLDLWPWNRYASRIKGGKFGFSSHSLCTRRTDGQLLYDYMDRRTKANLTAPSDGRGAGHNKEQELYRTYLSAVTYLLSTWDNMAIQENQRDVHYIPFVQYISLILFVLLYMYVVS